MTGMIVSIIIPCYNSSRYIGEAIDSVLAQTHTLFELILVNDGSTDETEIIIRSYTDSRIRYIYQPNRGQSAASNAGIAAAKGDYIKFLDADDVLHPDHLAAQLAVLKDDPGAVASCNWARFYNDDPGLAVVSDEVIQEDLLPVDWLKQSLSKRYDMMPGWLWLIPRTVLEKAGGWDESLTVNNDFEFSTRLLQHTSAVKYAADARLYYRSAVAGSLSSQKTEAGYRSAFSAAKKGCGHLLQMDSSTDMKRLCANKYLFWMFELYPQYPVLVKEMEAEVKKLGGGNRKIGGRSKIMHGLQQLFGWKFAKRCWLFFRKIGYAKWGLPLKKKLTAVLQRESVF